MKKQLIIYILFGVFLVILLGVFLMILLGSFTLRNHDVYKTIDETRTVYIKKTEKGFQLIRNGSPFYIQGAAGKTHFMELANAGGNTIRIYDTVNLGNILDKAQDANLAVIVDIPLLRYSKEYCPYVNEDYTATLKMKIKNLVKRHRNHPALLMWNLGNEIHYPSVGRKRVLFNYFIKSFYRTENSFINTFNELLDIIHREDPNHPVSTALFILISKNRHTSLDFNSPELDLVSYNTFGNVKDLKNLVEKDSLLIEKRPYYISEWGSDGYWQCELTPWLAPIEPTSTKKAEQIKERYKIITDLKDESCLGSLAFYWGEKQERTHTWFSIFLDNYKTEMYHELKNLWTGENTNSPVIGLEYMLVDNQGAKDSLIFTPNELKTSEIIMNISNTDSIKINWEIYPEDWYQNIDSDDFNPPETISDSFIGFEKNKATFVTPSTEGAYRIFVYVYDQNGFFATTNTPFYVLNNK